MAACEPPLGTKQLQNWTECRVKNPEPRVEVTVIYPIAHVQGHAITMFISLELSEFIFQIVFGVLVHCFVYTVYRLCVRVVRILFVKCYQHVYRVSLSSVL